MDWPTYTLTEARTLVRQRADMVSSDFVSDAELNQYLTDSITSLSAILIGIEGGNAWREKVNRSYTTSSGEIGVNIPKPFKLLGVGLLWPRTGTTEEIRWLDPLPWNADRDLRPTSWETSRPRYQVSRDPVDPTVASSAAPTAELQIFLGLFPLPDATWSVRVEYFPIFKFTGSGTEVPHVPWPDWVFNDAAAKCAVKEQNTELLAMLQAERAKIEDDIRRWAAPFDRGKPGFLDDVRGELDLEPLDSWGGWR